MHRWPWRMVDGNAVRQTWLFPSLLKITTVMGGSKTVRAVTGLRTGSANGMQRATFGESSSCLPRCLADALLAAATVDSSARGRLRLFPQLLKIMAVMGGGKTARAATGLRTESAGGMCELLSWMFELRVPMFGGCAADETAHGRR